MATLEVQGSAENSQVSIDGKAYGATPLARPIRLMPGLHDVVVQAPDGSSHRERIEATAGSRVILRVPAPVAAASTQRGQGAAPASPPAITPALRPVSPPGYAAVPSRDVSDSHADRSSDRYHAQRWGLSARADLDWRLAGAGFASSVTYGLFERWDLAAGGFVWPAGGLYVGGASLGSTVYLLAGALRPLVSLEAQVYGHRGLHFGFHAAVGTQWEADAHWGVFATLGLQRTSSTIVEGDPDFIVVPSLGLQARL